jgi:hypothetical protein
MKGLEPSTFCMANASDVLTRSRPFAQTACFQGLRPSERTRAHPSERRTLPFLPREQPAGPGQAAAAGRKDLIGTVKPNGQQVLCIFVSNRREIAGMSSPFIFIATNRLKPGRLERERRRGRDSLSSSRPASRG